MARNGAVTLDSNTISKPPCAQAAAPTPTPVPVPAHVSVSYQCATDGRVVVSVDLTAGVIVSGLGEAMTSATGTSGNPIIRYLAPGHYEWRATPPAGALMDVDHGVVEMAACAALPTPTLVPVAPTAVPTKVPVAFPVTGADLVDVPTLAAPQMTGVSLGFLSLGLLSLGLGLIVVATRRR
jgi:hypothetical protein